MKTHSFKRWIAGLLSAALCLSAFLGLGITKAFAKGEQAEVSLVSFPREGDANYSTTTWGHDDIKLMNGWFFQKGKYLTVYSMGSYGQCKRIGTNENQIQRTERKVQTFS